MMIRSFALTILGTLALTLAAACSSSTDKGNNGSSSSSSSGCSSQTDSKEAYLCIGDKCKCAGTAGDSYPYTLAEAKQKCTATTSSGTCSSGGTTSGGATSGGTSSGSSGSSGSSSGSSGTPDPEE